MQSETKTKQEELSGNPLLIIRWNSLRNSRIRDYIYIPCSTTLTFLKEFIQFFKLMFTGNSVTFKNNKPLKQTGVRYRSDSWPKRNSESSLGYVVNVNYDPMQFTTFCFFEVLNTEGRNTACRKSLIPFIV